MQPSRQRPNDQRRAWSRAWTIAVIAGLGLACSTDTRYRTLSFFFDGVPDPNAPAPAPDASAADSSGRAVAAAPGAADAPAKPRVVVVHGPVAAEQCTACHPFSRSDSRGSIQGVSIFGAGGNILNKPIHDLCVQCHDRFAPPAAAAAGQWLHGPVGAGACTFCHEHHRSLYPALLRAERPADLCVRCHDVDRLVADVEHMPPEEAGCTECHDPHRGDSRLLL